jgi:hypothetical protein
MRSTYLAAVQMLFDAYRDGDGLRQEWAIRHLRLILFLYGVKELE